jgi:PAS domain S-box-containing protein
MDEQLNHAPCGYVTFADDGRITACNRTLAHLLGYEPDELTGRHFELLLGVGGKIFYQTHFFPILKLKGEVEEVYLSLRTREGTDIPVLANAVRRAHGGPFLNECVMMRMLQRSQFEDELIQARKQAEAASDTKAKFLSMISHELRTPLQAISGYSDLLIGGVAGALNEEQLSDVRSIRSASDELVRLLNDILDFARLEDGQAEMPLQPVNVQRALHRAEVLLTPKFHEAGLAYSRVDCDADIAVRANPDRLQQVLLNLMTNAVKFTARGGLISIECEATRDKSLIRVRDTGSGIPEDQLGRIFEPFVQVDRHRVETRQRGVGLGLSISRELTRAMGGDLTVESTLGEGSVFTIALPRAEISEPAAVLQNA